MSLTNYVQTHIAEVFFSACVALVWIAANYTYPADVTSEFHEGKKKDQSVRYWPLWVLMRSSVAALIIGWIGRSLAIGLWTAAAAITFPLIRSRISPRLLAETEIAGNLTFAAGLALIAHLTKFTPSVAPGSEVICREASVILFIFAINLYILRGGTYVVRGILEKGRIFPARLDDKIQVDLEEYNRGRIIGNIERLILTPFVSMHAYSSLAFLTAAKGLFRAKDLENKAFSEYFLTGTLVSCMVAIAAGLLVQLVVQLAWPIASPLTTQ
jgi:hypothetical protein